MNDSHTPYLRIGIVQYFKFKSDINYVSETENSGVVNTEAGKADDVSKNQFGYWGAVGFSKAVYGTTKVFAEGRYERTNGFIGESFIDSISSCNSFQIIVGLKF